MQLVWTLRFFQAILQAHGTTDKKDNNIAYIVTSSIYFLGNYKYKMHKNIIW